MNMPQKKKRRKRVDTIIGRGSTLEGVLDIDHRIRVDGLLRGRLTTSDTLVVGEHGRVEGDVLEVDEAIVNGRVAGKLRATTLVYLAANAEFRGTIETPRLVIEEGAIAEFYTGPVHETEIKEFPGPGIDDNGDPRTPEGAVGAAGVRGGAPKQ